MSSVHPLGVRHAALECTDLKRTLDFYTQYLGFSPYAVDDADWAMLQLGDTYLSFVPVAEVTAARKQGSHVAHLGLTYADRASVEKMHAALTGKTRLGKIEEHRDGSYGFYLADPDGNSLEVIWIPHRALNVAPVGEAWLLLAHGSSDPQWATPFEKTVQSLRAHVPKIPCRLCFMERGNPTLLDAAKAVVEEGAKRVRVFPLFFSSGGAHGKQDIPALIAQAQKTYPKTKWELHSAIGETDLVQAAIVASIVRLAE